MIFVNFAVSDLKKAREFYEKIGFTYIPDWSNDRTATMQWNDTFVVMLLTHEEYTMFLAGRRVLPDTHKYNSVLISFPVESAERVLEIEEIARQNDGESFREPVEMPADQMIIRDIYDLDGNILSATWMKKWD